LGGSSREGSFKETITLKWCTPRTNNIGRCLKIIEKNKSEVFKALMWDQMSFLHFCFSLFQGLNKKFFKLIFPSVSELHYCTGAYRISPVDVNSRPSSCLTNFLLNGNFHHLIFLTVISISEIISENKRSGKLFCQNSLKFLPELFQK
jgi:hypothetical protein